MWKPEVLKLLMFGFSSSQIAFIWNGGGHCWWHYQRLTVSKCGDFSLNDAPRSDISHIIVLFENNQQYSRLCLVKIQFFRGKTVVLSPGCSPERMYMEAVRFSTPISPPISQDKIQRQDSKECRTLYLGPTWLKEMLEVCQCWQLTSFRESVRNAIGHVL